MMTDTHEEETLDVNRNKIINLNQADNSLYIFKITVLGRTLLQEI